MVDGSLSDELDVRLGVPQGSLLGPLLYVIYSSDLPEAIHRHEPPSSDLNQTPTSNFNLDCIKCGTVCCYADDSSFTVTGSDPLVISEQISSKYREISDFMVNNRLVQNSDKTHLLILTSPHRHRKHGNFNITLNTVTEIIEPGQSEVLLGAELSITSSGTCMSGTGRSPS